MRRGTTGLWLLVCGVWACGAPVKDGPPSEDALTSTAQSLTARPTPLTLGEVAVAKLDASRPAPWFRFDGTAGQKVDVFLDGLKGFDTVVSVYRVSRQTGRPYGAPLATNDDTPEPDWVLESNPAHNPLSSSLHRLELPETRAYAVVPTAFAHGEEGAAELLVQDVNASAKPLEVTPAQLAQTPDLYDGKKVAVTGRATLDPPMCTLRFCTATDPCCNSCGAGFKLGQVALSAAGGGAFGCSGDSCNWASQCDPVAFHQAGAFRFEGTFRKASFGLLILEVEQYRAARCFRGGCSGQLCTGTLGAASTCEFRPEYACYAQATCEPQADGLCGWTQTSELQTCLAQGGAK